jgi:lipopolysaccharide export system protein LptA
MKPIKHGHPVTEVLSMLILMACALAPATAFAERADRNQPVHLEADKVTVDDKQHIQIFEGDVRLSQGSLEIRCQRLHVTQDANGFQRGTAFGSATQPASFRQKREASNEYVDGRGDRIEHDSKLEKTEFFGNARVKSGKDEVSGPYIRYDGKTENYVVNGRTGETGVTPENGGRVRITIQPKNETVESAPVTR